jgi:hypothetical protein
MRKHSQQTKDFKDNCKFVEKNMKTHWSTLQKMLMNKIYSFLEKNNFFILFIFKIFR